MKSINLLCSLMMLVGISATGIAHADFHHDHHMAGSARPDFHHDHISGVARAEHHRSHGRVDFFFGAPFFYAPFYDYSYPYYPPVIAVPAEPPVYIEQGDASVPAIPENYYWYHCDNPNGYYPYIKACPDGWKKVTPTPPPQP